ncbi:MAG: hypothetical protein P8K14_02805 [Flavobacteriaceae bacterium]|jgi:hypothetical protein|nr:hypothetical protein [Flavobacteriaceae bacterium]
MKLNKIIFCLLILTPFLACEVESEYSKLLKKELKSGKSFNDLVLGLKIGQTKDDFYKICADLNKKKLITSGARSLYPEYILYPKDSIENGKKIRMSFMGIFDDDRIMKGMDIRFNYYSWIAWREEYNSDNLINEIKDTLQLWYPGNNFIEIDLKLDSKNNFAYVKIDGNRQITMYKIDGRDVAVIIEDLSEKIN